MKYYFLIGSVLGLICEFLVGYFLLRQALLELFTNSGKSGLFPILMGSLCVLAIGYFFDKISPFNRLEFFNNAMIKPGVIFTTGVLIGALVNYILNGSLQSDAFYSFFIKPIAWITPAGLVIATAVGIGYFFIRTRIL